MDRREAIITLRANVIYACESAGFAGATIKLVTEALDLAIEALKGDLHCPKCGTIVRDGRQYHDLVYRGEAEPKEHGLFSDIDDWAKRKVEEVTAPKEKQTDCISRADLLEKMKSLCPEPDKDCGYCYKGCDIEICIDYIVDAPSVTPTERTGEWERISFPDGDVMECTNCGYRDWADVWEEESRNYCPNCGAKMKGGTENE